MKIFDRLRKHKDKSTENSSSHDLNSIVKDAAEKWEKIFSFLKGDLGNIWYPEELATFELLRNDIEKIKVLIERMRSFLEKNKIETAIKIRKNVTTNSRGSMRRSREDQEK